jgi:hypothetical protein
MTHRIAKAIGSSAVIAAVAIAGAAPAVAAPRHHRRTHATRHAAVARTGSAANKAAQTALTGSTLASASASAIAANPGATVTGATTYTDSSISGAAYAVHITKADGTRPVVIEDSSFKVLATRADDGCQGHSSSANQTATSTSSTSS